MKGFQNTITIQKPIDQVFRFVSDQRNNPKWNYFVKDVKLLNERSGEGATYLQTRKTDQQRLGIVTYRLNELVVIETLPGERPAVSRQFLFEGDDQQTILKDQFIFKLPLPAFLVRLALRAPKRAVAENLRKLKTLLETGEVILQDGRKSFYGE